MQRIIIAAVAQNGCIGRDGKMPWHIPEDLKRFKKQTVGNAVIMGRKTYESIGKPLVDRLNLVVTRNWQSSLLNEHNPNLVFCRDMISAFQCAKTRELGVFVIGGAEVYKQSLSMADEMRLTILPDEYEGDAFFPEWPVSSERWVIQEDKTECGSDGIKYVTYQRLKY